MAHGKSLELAAIRNVPQRIWSPVEWAKRPGTIPGDPRMWPQGNVPMPRRQRRGRFLPDWIPVK